PTNTLTRQAAAKIICNLILGPTTAAELHADTAPYKDVPTTSEFAGYIAYCAKEGIISGYADGTFKPGNTLTGYAFMKMLLGALGYDADTELYTGANWSINVAKQALGIGLNDGLEGEFNGIKAVTREEACLYAFNTLKATMVEYDEKTTINVGGAQVTLQGKAQDVSWGTATLNDGNIKSDGYVQFAEKYFTKLVGADDIDAFGRPSTTWSYNKKEIGTYVDWTLMVAEYTTSVDGGDAYTDIGKTAVEDYRLLAYTDGVTSKTLVNKIASEIYKKSEETVGDTGKGALTQIFVDVDEEEVTITTINTYLAEVTADYSTKSETLPLKVYTSVASASGSKPEAKTTSYRAELDEVANIPDFEDEDIVMVTIADGVIKSVEEPEVIAETSISSYATGYDTGITNAEQGEKYRLKNVTADGTKYEVAKKGYWDAQYMYNYAETDLKDNIYNLYLDPYGYVIGVECVDESTDYVFIVGYEVGSSYLAKATDKALVILPDGTMETVEIDDSKLDTRFEESNANVNSWFKYTTDKNGVFVLKDTVTTYHDVETAEINGSSTTVEDKTKATTANPEGVLYGNGDSVYISVKANTDVDKAGSIVDVKSVTTGIKKTSIKIDTDSTLTPKGIYACAKDGYVRYAVVVGKSAGVSEDLVYLVDGITRKYYDSDLDDYYYTYDVVRNGEIVEIKSLVNKDTADDYLEAHYLYEASFDSDGYVAEMELKEPTKDLGLALQTKTYRDESYMRVEFDTLSELTLKAATLYLNPTSNDEYVVLDDECNFFVYASDDDEYVEYSDADDALDALGTDTKLTGFVTAICGANGYATTLIIYDTYTGNDETITRPGNPGFVVPVGYSAEVNEALLTITVTAPNGAGTTVTDAVKNAAGQALLDEGYQPTKWNADSVEATIDGLSGNSTKTFTISVVEAAE
ncbi:MAG: S-layer homology domain-containing protein, partial [Oscillospiraceae bacterium]|nr:S-layer homology domain-containing protein [Oscillospiraceae bacterium]